MRATANASSKQLPLVTRHSHGACGFIRRMIRAFVCDQCNTLSFSVILQRCISCSLYVASNQMPHWKYWVFTAVWLKASFSAMTLRHRVIGSRPLEPWIWIHWSLETPGTDYVVTRRYTAQSEALKSWSDLARDVTNWSLQFLRWHGHCKVPSQQSETRKSRSPDRFLNWIRSECIVTEQNLYAEVR